MNCRYHNNWLFFKIPKTLWLLVATTTRVITIDFLRSVLLLATKVTSGEKWILHCNDCKAPKKLKIIVISLLLIYEMFRETRQYHKGQRLVNRKSSALAQSAVLACFFFFFVCLKVCQLLWIIYYQYHPCRRTIVVLFSPYLGSTVLPKSIETDYIFFKKALTHLKHCLNDRTSSFIYITGPTVAL